MRPSFQLLFIAFLLVSLSLQSTPTVPARDRVVVVESRFQVTDASKQAALVQQVVDFPVGAWTSPHSHGGQAINLVLEGEITLRQNGVDRAHQAGESWTDSTGQVHAAGNTGSTPARLLTNFLLPAGAEQTKVEGTSQLQPTVTYEERHPLPTLPAEADIVQQAVDLPPGWTGSRAYGGFVASIVIQGSPRYVIGEEEKNFGEGQGWSARAGIPVQVTNSPDSPTRLFTTYVIPKGTDPLAPPASQEGVGRDAVEEPGTSGPSQLWPVFGAAAAVVVIVVAALAFAQKGRSRNPVA